jgi:hypothetical protein
MNAKVQSPVRVICIKGDGRRALFKEYPPEQLGQARLDRDALRGFGIDAVVEGDAASAGDVPRSGATP